jgi:hypothetical protein
MLSVSVDVAGDVCAATCRRVLARPAGAAVTGTDTIGDVSLPPPPPPSTGQAPAWVPAPRPPSRPGTLTIGWRVATAVGWGGVLLGIAAVWDSSRTMGLATWWLGAASEPQPFVVQLFPAVVALVVVVAALRNLRFLPGIGIGAAAVLIGVGLVDLGRFPRFGWIELALASAGLLVSVASFAGLQRATEPAGDGARTSG